MRRLVAACLTIALLLAATPGRVAQAAPTSLQALLDGRVASFSGGAGIYVSDGLTGTPLYAHNPDELVVTASLYKLAVLLEAERRVDAGTSQYSEPITIEPEDITEDGAYEPAGTTMSLDEALEKMITVSDNGTALALERIFGARQINQTLVALGIQPFRLWEDPVDDNVASPRAIATYFTLMAQHKLVSKAVSDRMLQRLERQQINDRLPAQLPPGTVIAHKTGNLGFVTHDTGVIYRQGGDPLVVVAMTWNSSQEEAVELIQDVGSLAYANAAATPTNVGYALPQQPVAADAGRPLVQSVRITNLGPNDWTTDATDRLRLIWQMADAKGAVVSRNDNPVRLWNVKASATIDVPVVISVPERPGDYTVTVGLMDDAHGPLANFGTATDSFSIHAHPPYLVSLGLSLSPLLHRDEPSVATATLSPLPNLSAAGEFQLGWRVHDPRNNRVLAQGTAPLGKVVPGQSGSYFTAVNAPSLRGTFILELFAMANGELASAPLRSTVLIASPRTYPGELAPGEGRGGSPTPRRTPLPSAGKTPAGKTPLPRP